MRSSKAKEESVGKLIRVGAERVISPYQIAGRRIVSVFLRRPTVLNDIDTVGNALRDFGIGRRKGAIIGGIRDLDGEVRDARTLKSPLSTDVIWEGDASVILGSEEHPKTLMAFAEDV